MSKTKVGFVVFGVHKDGLQVSVGEPFIDENLVENAKKVTEKEVQEARRVHSYFEEPLPEICSMLTNRIMNTRFLGMEATSARN